MKSDSVIRRFQKGKCCYYCGKPGPSSREHAPFRRMFEAFDCDSITVPACDQHNSDRSLVDRAVLVFLLRGLEHGFRSMSLTDNQLKAYACAQHKLGHATEVTAKAMVTDPQGELETSLSYIDQTPMVETYMRQLTAAIVWAVIGEFDSGMHWDEAVVWSPQYVSAAGPLSVHEAGLQLKSQKFLQARIDQHTPYWWPGWSSYPKGYPSDIYRFEVSLAPSQYVLSEERSRQVWLRHWFFGQFPWYVWFIASERTKDTIADAIRAISG